MPDEGSRLSDDLEARARRAGIAEFFTDIWGNRHAVPSETKEALIAALGEPPPGPPSLLLVRAERGTTIDIEGIASARLLREDGGSGELPVENGRIALPPLPMGYHRLALRLADHRIEAVLLAAPERCYLPPAMRGDGRVWGLAVQLYALRSPHNWGIGDFSDLADLARRTAAFGVDCIGVNPLHALFPEKPEQFSPYAPSSRLFLNYLYLDVTQIEGFDRSTAARAHTDNPEFRERLAALRAAPLVDYDGVAALKRPVLELLFQHFESDGDASGFTRFRARMGEALHRHALFEALSEHFRGTPEPRHWWGDWPEPYRDPASAESCAFAEAHGQRVRFFAWLQFHCERQLAAAQEAAKRAGMAIGLYRDLAVGADLAGAEIWLEPERYARGISVGAPPDAYNLAGQNWGLPPLNPLVLQATGGRPFAELVRANMAHAGALRIDHALGLARLFHIPRPHGPKDGAYVSYPMEALLAVLKIESHRRRCLVVGEDLGTVPEGFSDTLMQAGIFSYRVLLFQREADGAFAPPNRYPPAALVTASTHDLPTLVGWWRGADIELRQTLGLYPDEDSAARDRAGREGDRLRLIEALKREGLIESASTPSEPPLAAMQRFLARSPSKLMMVQIEDVLGLVEQANLPGTSTEHPNWRRRLPLMIDSLVAADSPLADLAGSLVAERPRVWQRQPVAATPRATYRLQLHEHFTFDDAAKIVPYLASLGISHVYTSPYLAARPGSVHGYDIIDHARFNPELGGEAGFQRFLAALDADCMGHILDFVPNHMGVGGADNGWWLEVLEWGPLAPSAAFFDIDWRPRQGNEAGKLILPILGRQYGEELEAGTLMLRFDRHAGSFAIWYFDHLLPIRPTSYAELLDVALANLVESRATEQAIVELTGLAGDFRALSAEPDRTRLPGESVGLKRRLAELAGRFDELHQAIEQALGLFNGETGKPATFAALDRLLDAQCYRVAFWRVAADEINYRRFFDINDLAGLRMEDPELFERAHRLVLTLIDQSKLYGLRIDHIDGLADPAGYCRQLRHEIGPDLPLYVEKILAPHESLRPWPIDGSTGYEFLNQLNGLFIAQSGERSLDRLYRRYTGRRASFEEELVAAKRQVLETTMASELRTLGLDAKRLADSDWRTRDYTIQVLRQALADIIAWFPVYRAYVTPGAVAAEDRHYVEWAVARAAKRSTLADRGIYDFLRDALLLELGEKRGGSFSESIAERVVTKFQQLSGPVMAKGAEDTAFYRYTRLLSLNEVGGDPGRFGGSAASFHHQNAERCQNAPRTLLATATHDTKRGEQVRLRLDLLSEMPRDWGLHVVRWTRLNRSRRHEIDGAPAPTPNDEYLLYQTLLGSWPIALMGDSPPAPEPMTPYVERIIAYMTKAMREAKESTSWNLPNEAYEEAVADFVRGVLDTSRPNLFLADFMPLQRSVAALGMINDLSQTALKLTLPGVPDIYQGSELWDLSLVDPDNRRPVDYAARKDGLDDARPIEALLADWTDGRVKQRLIRTLLALRAARPELFERGDYQPLTATGARAEHVFAYMRRCGDSVLVVAVPILIGTLARDGTLDELALWGDTALELPAAGPWHEQLTQAVHHGRQLALAPLFARFPQAVLLAEAG
jgi:(1->4)-alpha-D-glucan 1-alpha-D-glucosylmutase